MPSYNPGNAITPPTGSNEVAKNGYSGKSQTQWGAGDQAAIAATSSTSKGGMRGLGLIAVMIAEIVLKNKATSLAEDYYKTNKKDFVFFTATHENAMKQTAEEAFDPVDNPAYVPDYYASAPAGMAKSSILDKQWFEIRRRSHRYATGAMQRVDFEFAALRVHAIVAGWNIARRYEDNYADDHNNRAFDRKVAAANIGIGVGNIVRQGLASSVAGLASSYDNLGDTVASIGNGLAASSGYNAGRNYAKNKFDAATKDIRKS